MSSIAFHVVDNHGGPDGRNNSCLDPTHLVPVENVAGASPEVIVRQAHGDILIGLQNAMTKASLTKRYLTLGTKCMRAVLAARSTAYVLWTAKNLTASPSRGELQLPFPICTFKIVEGAEGISVCMLGAGKALQKFTQLETSSKRVGVSLHQLQQRILHFVY